MSEVVAIGAPPRLAGFALAGARLVPADTPAEVRAAWRALPATVGAVILTPAAAEAIGAARLAEQAPLSVVMPG